MTEDKPITEEEVGKAVGIIEHIRLRNHLHDPDSCSGCEEAELSLELYPRLIADWRKLRERVGRFLEVQGPCHNSDDDPPHLCEYDTCAYCAMARAVGEKS